MRGIPPPPASSSTFPYTTSQTPALHPQPLILFLPPTSCSPTSPKITPPTLNVIPTAPEHLPLPLYIFPRPLSSFPTPPVVPVLLVEMGTHTKESPVEEEDMQTETPSEASIFHVEVGTQTE
ncbi:uncharacterized protein LOC135198961 [Macrobrachium nipponense]|uniref:uncharacterized protein LOC135198961 n=1 Tax=Macrobrachium nipponense TaxID=159736 RepID=UPI0030C84558